MVMPKPKAAPDPESVDKHIAKRYEIFDKIGIGAYGIVWKARDKSTGNMVAVKKVFGAFRNATDAQRTYREIFFLRELRGSQHIVELLAVHEASNNLDIYLVFELMKSDVHCVIRANILQDVHKRFITWQMAMAIRACHARHLIHRDLKPSNLLINSDSSIKLCDFGFARTFTDENVIDATMTDYVSTRWYRAPELIIGTEHYSEAVDLWAIGCIVAELIGGKPLFPGKSTLEQLEMVVSFTGRPSPSDIDSIYSPYAGTMISQLEFNIPRFTLEQRLPNADCETIDFIKKLLVWNPANRMNIDAALAHPFLAEFNYRSDVALNSEPLKASLKDTKKYTVNDYRRKIYKTFLIRKAEALPKLGDPPLA
jgi:mitogen-activated protein kinase 15